MKDKEGKIEQAKICVISYPNSGRTWLRVLLGKALCDQYGLGEHFRFIFDSLKVTAAAGLPTMDYTHDGTRLSQAKHFEDLETDKSRYQDKKVILLLRDPRDLVVSCYFQASRMRNLYEGSLSDFIRDDHYGIRKIVTFYDIWHAHRHVPEAFLVLRYEEMHADPAGSLRLVLDFMGAPLLDDGVVAKAVEYASFDNMKKMEQDGYFASEKIKTGRPGDEESYKVRRGKVDGYVDYLSPEDCQYLDAVTQELGCAFFAK